MVRYYNMKNCDEMAQSLNYTKEIVNNASWFRDTPHYWAAASLPLAYAMACVEVVSKRSVKAGTIYQKIIEMWCEPGTKSFFDSIASIITESEKEKIKQAIIHPETELLPDPNKPFRDFEEMFSSAIAHADFFKDSDNELSLKEDDQAAEEVAKLANLILEFIVVGFNRESEIAKWKYSVLPSENNPWLIIAIVLRTSAESYNITLERIRNYYKLRQYKGKIIDFHKVLTEQPMSRWHRRIIAHGKAAKLRLKNDRIFVDAAHAWYKCRVVYPSVNKYCEAPENYHLDPKNVDKQIRPCDDAIGYVGRLRRTTKN
jgi:hypothetical protein